MANGEKGFAMNVLLGLLLLILAWTGGDTIAFTGSQGIACLPGQEEELSLLEWAVRASAS